MKSRTIIRRFKHEKYDTRFIALRLQGGGGSIGLWGCITFNGSGLHALYDGRFNAPRYIEILKNALIPTRDLYFGQNNKIHLWIFQQDGAPCHSATLSSAWFDKNNIRIL